MELKRVLPNVAAFYASYCLLCNAVILGYKFLKSSISANFKNILVGEFFMYHLASRLPIFCLHICHIIGVSRNVSTVSRIALMTGEELKTFREKLELSQDQLAKELKVARNTVSRWELEERKIPEFLELALQTIERRINDGEKVNAN